MSLVQAQSPSIVFLCETRQSKNKMKRVRTRLGLRGFDAFDCVGRSGGLALFWEETLSVTVLESYNRFIDIRVHDAGSDTTWRGTFVYGELRVENRQRMWDHLCSLRAISQDPWVVCGDFNEALWQHEHLSIMTRSESQMEVFRDCLVTCELQDLGFSGLPYTYNNGQEGHRNVQVCLDRACADEALRDLFPAARVVHLATSCSDHSPLLVNLEGVQEQRRRPTTSRYEIMWERDSQLLRL